MLSEEDESDLLYSRFFVIAAKDGNPIKYNIFAVQKFIQCGVGDVKVAKKLQNGTVLLEVSSKEHAQKAVNMTNWFDTPITVTPHRSLNTSRGVIRCRELRDCNDSEVLMALSSQGVVEAKHILTKRNDKLEPTNTFILTFKMPTPPKNIKIAYMNVNVDLYIPNPLRCYKCQRFGHGKNSCNRQAACAKCGQEGHEDTACQAPLHCANCAGTHAAFSKECPAWVKQRAITQVKFEKNISFFEAKQAIEKQEKMNNALGSKHPGISYAKAAKTLTSTASTQTDLTWPLDSRMPVSVTNVAPLKKQSSTAAQTDAKQATSAKGKDLVKAKPVQRPGPAFSKPLTNRGRKGANDPIKQYNRFGALDDPGGGEDEEGDDDMDYQAIRAESSSPKKKAT